MCAYGDDTYEVYVRVTRTAVKRHRCAECRSSIEPGARYERVTGLYDGRWDSLATCPHCVEGRRFLDVICAGSWLHCDVWEETYQHVDELDGMTRRTWLHDLTGRMSDDEAEDRAEQIAQTARAWTHPGAVVARLVRLADRHWDGVDPAQVREMAQDAIEVWQRQEEMAA